MAKWNVKLIGIGNSRGMRIPRVLLDKYGSGDSLVLEETKDGVLLSGTKSKELSWKETYRDIAAEIEDWSDLDVIDADGLG